MRLPWLALAAVLASLALAKNTRAQCGAKQSTCSGCHDGARATFARDAAWHEDHAFADVCPTCHGGDGEAKEIDAAHASLVAPLVEERCRACHGAGAAAFVERYHAALVARADAGVEGSALPGAPSRPAGGGTIDPHGDATHNAAMVAALCIVALLGGAFIARNERARRASPGASPAE